MTAPERIWAEPDGEDIIIHNGAPDLAALIATGYLHEYTRTDIHQAALDRIAELEGELGWYGEQALLARLIHSEGDIGRHSLAEDGGKRARDVLAKGDG